MKKSTLLVSIFLVTLLMSAVGMAKNAASASGAPAAGNSMGRGFTQSGGARSNAAPPTSSTVTKGPSFGSFGSDSANPPHLPGSTPSSALTRDLETTAAKWRALERYDATKGTPTANKTTIPGRDLPRGSAAAAPAALPITSDRAVNAQPRAGPSQVAGDSTSNDALWGVAAGYILSRTTTGDAGAHSGGSQSTGAPGLAADDSTVTSNRTRPPGPIAEGGIAGVTNLVSAVGKFFAALGLFIPVRRARGGYRHRP